MTDTGLKQPPDGKRALVSEILILPDGRVLGHSLTRMFSQLLSELNPDDPQIRPRTPEALASESTAQEPIA